MSDDAMDDFDRLFGLPDEFKKLVEKIGILEKQIQKTDQAALAGVVWDSNKNAAERYLQPALGAASDMRSAAKRFDSATAVTLVQRKKMLAAFGFALLLVAFTCGLSLGRSPTLTELVIRSETGCQWLGGRLMAAKVESGQKAVVCAFETDHRS